MRNQFKTAHSATKAVVTTTIGTLLQRCLHKCFERCERDAILPADLERSQITALDHT